MTTKDQTNGYPTKPTINAGMMTDLFTLPGGQRIVSASEWPDCSRAWRDLIVDVEYGGMPPAPQEVVVETLCHTTIGHLPSTPCNWSYRVHCYGGVTPFSFCIRLLFPKTDRPVPVIINGDTCWWYINEDIIELATSKGFALALFNRTEMAEDLGYSEVVDKTSRKGGLYDSFPEMTYSAISAWAWGYHRCVDMLSNLPFIDKTRIAVTGHSRGGKTVLLAAATDTRITLVNDNGSGAGGSGLFRYVGNNGETLTRIVNAFPSWFGPKMAPFINNEANLSFDQHCFLATIAPRLLLTTQGIDDRWANPEGTVLCHRAVREAYKLLASEDNLAFHFRNGGHSHHIEDWSTLIDFASWKWKGIPPSEKYNVNPYKHLPNLFTWSAP